MQAFKILFKHLLAFLKTKQSIFEHQIANN